MHSRHKQKRRSHLQCWRPAHLLFQPRHLQSLRSGRCSPQPSTASGRSGKGPQPESFNDGSEPSGFGTAASRSPAPLVPLGDDLGALPADDPAIPAMKSRRRIAFSGPRTAHKTGGAKRRLGSSTTLSARAPSRRMAALPRKRRKFHTVARSRGRCRGRSLDRPHRTRLVTPSPRPDPWARSACAALEPQ
jgi:hypothetical protein